MLLFLVKVRCNTSVAQALSLRQNSCIKYNILAHLILYIPLINRLSDKDLTFTFWWTCQYLTFKFWWTCQYLTFMFWWTCQYLTFTFWWTCQLLIYVTCSSKIHVVKICKSLEACGVGIQLFYCFYHCFFLRGFVYAW